MKSFKSETIGITTILLLLFLLFHFWKISYLWKILLNRNNNNRKRNGKKLMHSGLLLLKQKEARGPQNRGSGEQLSFWPNSSILKHAKHENMQLCKNNLNAVGELFAVFSNERSFHRVLQMPGKRIAHFQIIIIIIIVSLLADIVSNGDTLSCPLLVQTWTFQN